MTTPNPNRLLTTKNPNLAKQWHPTKNTLNLQTTYANSGQQAHWQCPKCNHQWQAQIASRNRGNGCPNCAGKITNKTNSLQHNYPKIAKQYHPTRNPKPINTIKKGMRTSVWWQCKKGHEWKTSPYNRVKQNDGCSYCGGRFATPENNLQQANPKIAKQWHPTKNGTQTPKTTTPKSNKPVWWQCEKRHEWKTIVNDRTVKKSGCPYCMRKKVSPDNNLAVTHPKIAAEWHPELNKLTPTEVLSGSKTHYWWQCSTNPQHIWKTGISTRTAKNGSNCKDCSPTPRTSKLEKRIREHLSELITVQKTKESGIYVPTPLSDRKRVEVDMNGTYKSHPIVIEYDSYYWHSGRGGTDDPTPSMERDIRKTQRLLENGYTVIRIREKRHKVELPYLPYNHEHLHQIAWGEQDGYELLKEKVQKLIETLN